MDVGRQQSPGDFVAVAHIPSWEPIWQALMLPQVCTRSSAESLSCLPVCTSDAQAQLATDIIYVAGEACLLP